jgi:hypothetical protein
MSRIPGTTELRWICSSSASAFHAAEALARGLAILDVPLRDALRAAVDRLQSGLNSLGVSADLLWRHVVPLAAGVENDRELADTLLRKCVGARQPDQVARLAGHFGEIERIFRRLHAGCVDELALRGRPLRELWEGRGPGLLTKLGELTDPELILPRADVILVQPVLGGGGKAHLAYNAVHIEAVLANPEPSLPEIVRLAWLLSQLNLELPRYTEQLPAARLCSVAALAMVPPVLAAAEYVELGALNEVALQAALRTWGMTTKGTARAGTLLDWWETYRETRPAFELALRALDQML